MTPLQFVDNILLIKYYIICIINYCQFSVMKSINGIGFPYSSITGINNFH